MCVVFINKINAADEAPDRLFEKHYHVWYDSHGNYSHRGWMSDGDEETANRKLIKVFYHIIDSDGDTNTLNTSLREEQLGIDGEWNTVFKWNIEADELRLFFDTHTSNVLDPWWHW